MYLADRECLRISGRPIVDAIFVALPHGPLHDRLLELVRRESLSEPAWSRYIERDGYSVHLIASPGASALSSSDVRLLRQVSERFCDLSDWELAAETQACGEWRKNYRPSTVAPIPLGDVFDGLGFSPEERDDVLREVADEERLERELAAADQVRSASESPAA